MTCQRGRGGSVTGQSCCSHRKAFPAGFLLLVWFPATSELILFPSPVPGGIASESLTFTPLEDMIFLKWEEPVEPNGLITQYEVDPGQLGHPRGPVGTREGSSRVSWDNCCFGSWGLRAAAALQLPLSPWLGAGIQPVLNLLPEGPSQLGSPAFGVTSVTQQGLF